MRLFEFDWQHTWTFEALDVIDRGLDRLVDALPEPFDVGEHAEEMVGLGFVALQTYIRAACRDARDGFPHCPGLQSLHADESPRVNGTEVTYVEAVWAVANFYKHHEDWPDWKAEGRRRPTVIALTRLGISRSTYTPCITALTMLQGEQARLLDCLSILRSWRTLWFARLARA